MRPDHGKGPRPSLSGRSGPSALPTWNCGTRVQRFLDVAPAGGDSMFTNFKRRLHPFNRSRQSHPTPNVRARGQASAGSTDGKGNGTITRGCQQLVAEASAAIETIPAAEAMKDLHKEGVVFID